MPDSKDYYDLPKLTPTDVLLQSGQDMVMDKGEGDKVMVMAIIKAVDMDMEIVHMERVMGVIMQMDGYLQKF